MKPRRREQSTEGEIETETSWGWEGKKKKPKAKVDLKFRRCEGEMEIFFLKRFRDHEVWAWVEWGERGVRDYVRVRQRAWDEAWD